MDDDREPSHRFLIGNQTAFSVPVAEPFAFAVEHHFDAFEFFPDAGPNGRGWSAGNLGAVERDRFRATATESRIRLSVHAALEAQLLDQGTWAGLMRDIDLARDLGARVLNLHLAPGNPAGCACAALALVEILQPLGIRLALENTVATGPDEVNQIFRLIANDRRGQQPSVGLCFDMGHANLCSATRNDYLRFLDGLGDHVPIVHAHIHENWGDADSHLTLFTGPAGKDSAGVVGLLRRLRQRSFRGALILEQWPTPRALLLAARARLRLIQDEQG